MRNSEQVHVTSILTNDSISTLHNILSSDFCQDICVSEANKQYLEIWAMV